MGGADHTPADPAAAQGLDHGPIAHFRTLEGTELRPQPVAGPARPGVPVFVELMAFGEGLDRPTGTPRAPQRRRGADLHWHPVVTLPFIASSLFASALNDYRLLGFLLVTATGTDQALAHSFGRSVLFGFAGPNARGVVLGAYAGLAVRQLMRRLSG